MAEFGLIKSFNIDDGELDGRSPQECFVLGYELAVIDEQLKNQFAGFSIPVHSDNKERIEQSCRDANREFTLTFAANDSSESWMQLTVPRVGGLGSMSDE